MFNLSMFFKIFLANKGFIAGPKIILSHNFKEKKIFRYGDEKYSLKMQIFKIRFLHHLKQFSFY